MLICTVKSTGELIEARSSVEAKGELIAEAMKTGYSADAIEEKIVTDQEFFAIMASRPEVQAAEIVKQQKLADIAQYLPDWATVRDRFDQGTTALDKATTDLAAATTLAQVRPVIGAIITVVKGLVTVTLGMARVLYWLVKNSAT